MRIRPQGRLLSSPGLRNVNIQKESMTRRLDLTEFKRLFKSRAVSKQAVQILNKDTESTTSIKKEVSIVRNDTMSSSNTASNYL